jgi:tetratricopeptide (TPR) repeat protein
MKHLLSQWLPKPKTAVQCYNQALQQFQQQNWPVCIQLLTRCLDLDAQFADAHYNLACALQQTGQLDDAQTHLQQVLTLRPDDRDALYNLALLYLNRQQWQAALPLFEQFKQHVPDDASAWLGTGLCLNELDNPTEAQQHFQHALTLDPNLPVAHYQLARALLKQNPAIPDGIEQIIAHYQQALPDYQQDVTLHLDMSLMYAKLSQWPKAMDHALTCVTLDPNHSKGYNQLGLSLYCQDQYDEAIVHFQHALELDPTYQTVYNNLTFAFEKNGQLDDALSALNTYLDTLDDPDERAATEEHMRELLKKGAKP